jgi:hypothetical protein
MKFKVLNAIKFNGKRYAVGDTLEADDKGAALLPAGAVEQIKEAKAKKADKPDATTETE